MSDYKKLGFWLYVNRTCHLVFLFSQPWHVHTMTELLIPYNKLEKHSKSADLCQVGTWRERERECQCQNIPQLHVFGLWKEVREPKENPHKMNMKPAQRKAPGPKRFEPGTCEVHHHTVNFKFHQNREWFAMACGKVWGAGSTLRSSTVDSWSLLLWNVLCAGVSTAKYPQRSEMKWKRGSRTSREVLFYTSVHSVLQRWLLQVELALLTECLKFLQEKRIPSEGKI